jgi:putative hydrolase of HD superfamily
MNLIDMCLQALLYEQSGRYAQSESQTNAEFPDFQGLEEFFATSKPRIGTELGARLLHDLHARYSELPSVRARSR